MDPALGVTFVSDVKLPRVMDFGFVAIDRYDSPWVEMKRRDRCTRVYEFHMGVFIACLFVGWACIHSHRRFGDSALVVGLLSFAGLLRSGSVPVHCWMTDLIEKQRSEPRFCSLLR